MRGDYMSEPDEKKMWFEYIAKTNDRRQAKRRASGITTWAIYGLLAYLLTSFVIKIPQYNSPQALKTVTLGVTSANNFIICITMILYVVRKRITFSPHSFRLFSRIGKKINYFSNWAGLLFCIIAVLLNAIVIFVAYNPKIPTWPNWIIGIYLSASIILALKERWQAFRREKYLNGDIPEMPKNIFSTKGEAVGASLLFLILTICTSVPIIASFWMINTDRHVSLVTISIQLCVTMYAFLHLISQSMEDTRQSYLEGLECKIVLDNMTVEQIRDAYVLDYMGETTRRWVQGAESELNRQYELMKEIMQDIKQSVIQINSIDSTYHHEIKGKKKEICTKLHEHTRDYLTLAKNSLERIQIVADKNNFKYESELFEKFNENWEQQYNEVLNLKEEACRYCSDVQCHVEIDFCSITSDSEIQ